ncbi:MAG: serine hydrolase, partial [Clostridia bacterium]|nr:serine hydrolase [Clostridia bacterium]
MQTTEKQQNPEPNAPQANEVSVSSRAIASMLGAFSEAGLSMHSVLVMRHGEIVSECYAPPFDENSLHRMYSVSKSFVGMSVGLLVSDSRYSHLFPQGINTKIGDLACFSNYITSSTDRRIKDTEIVDLLRMASPFPKGSTYDGPNDMDWAATFFNPASGRKPDHEPGTKFKYDTSASYILDVM